MTLPPPPNPKLIRNSNFNDQKITEPKFCRVSILTSNTQFDIALPENGPLYLLMPDIIQLITSHDQKKIKPEAAKVESKHWSLGKIGDTNFDSHKSLAELGVKDGDLLLLKKVSNKTPTVLFDDVVEAITDINTNTFSTRTALPLKWTGYAIALLCTLAIAILLIIYRTKLDNIITPTLLTILVAIILVIGIVLHNYYKDKLTAGVVFLIAIILSFPAIALFINSNTSVNLIVVGSAAILLTSFLAMNISEHFSSVFLGIITFTGSIFISNLVMLFNNMSFSSLGIILSLIGVILLAMAARLTTLIAKLPLPQIPTIGEPLDVELAAESTQLPGISAVATTNLPDINLLVKKAKQANTYLTGIILGACCICFTGSLILALTNQNQQLRSSFYLLLLGLIILLRNRVYVDLIQASILITGGTLIIIVFFFELAKYGSFWILLTIIIAIFISVIGIVTGLISSTKNFSPLQRRLSELFEYIVIGLLFPVALWTLGLFEYVRNL